jgi:hypothetical protein
MVQLKSYTKNFGGHIVEEKFRLGLREQKQFKYLWSRILRLIVR